MELFHSERFLYTIQSDFSYTTEIKSYQFKLKGKRGPRFTATVMSYIHQTAAGNLEILQERRDSSSLRAESLRHEFGARSHSYHDDRRKVTVVMYMYSHARRPAVSERVGRTQFPGHAMK